MVVLVWFPPWVVTVGARGDTKLFLSQCHILLGRYTTAKPFTVKHCFLSLLALLLPLRVQPFSLMIPAQIILLESSNAPIHIAAFITLILQVVRPQNRRQTFIILPQGNNQGGMVYQETSTGRTGWATGLSISSSIKCITAFGIANNDTNNFAMFKCNLSSSIATILINASTAQYGLGYIAICKA